MDPSTEPQAQPLARARTVAIMQPSYLPWLGHFSLAFLSDAFVFYDDVQFDKHGWRHRNRILLAGQPHWLTVPVLQKGRFGQLVKETEIADSKWQSKHLKTIEQAYRRAPHFDQVFPVMNEYLTKKNYTWLMDLSIDGFNAFCRLFEMHPKTCFSSDLGHRELGRTERLVAICKDFGAERYLSPNASSEYMLPEAWLGAGIELQYQNYDHPVYQQGDGEFVSHLSALDALMFLGPEARRYLGNSRPGPLRS